MPLIPIHDVSFSESFTALSRIYNQAPAEITYRPGTIRKPVERPEKHVFTSDGVIAGDSDPTYKSGAALAKLKDKVKKRREVERPFKIRRMKDKGSARVAELKQWVDKRPKWRKQHEQETESAPGDDENVGDDDAADDKVHSGGEEVGVEDAIKSLRSVSDVAIMKTEERKRKREQQPADLALTGYGQSLFKEKVKKKLKRPASDDDSDIDIPAEMFDSGDDSVAPLAKKSAKSASRKSRVSLQPDPGTPLRRSNRIRSVNN
jgi:hypothetical protein